jgi:hypothetical protein
MESAASSRSCDKVTQTTLVTLHFSFFFRRGIRNIADIRPCIVFVLLKQGKIAVAGVELRVH